MCLQVYLHTPRLTSRRDSRLLRNGLRLFPLALARAHRVGSSAVGLSFEYSKALQEDVDEERAGGGDRVDDPLVEVVADRAEPVMW